MVRLSELIDQTPDLEQTPLPQKEPRRMRLSDLERLQPYTPPAPKPSFGEQLGEGVDEALGGASSVAGRLLVMFGDYVRGEEKKARKRIGEPEPTADGLSAPSRTLGDRIYNAGLRLQNENQRALSAKFPEREKRTFAKDLGAGAVSLATSLGIAAATRNPALVGVAFGIDAKGQAYFDAKASGKDAETASKISTAVGAGVGAWEYLGVGWLLRSHGTILQRAIKGYVSEAFQEFGQTGTEIAIRTASGLQEYKGKESIIEGLSQAAYAGVIGGVLGSAASVPIALYHRQALEDGYRQAGMEPEQAKEAADLTFKKGMDKVTTAVEEKADEEALLNEREIENVEPERVVQPTVIEQAQEKLDKISQFEMLRDSLLMKDRPDIQEELNKRIAEIQLTPEEENALLAEIRGEVPSAEGIGTETQPPSQPEGAQGQEESSLRLRDAAEGGVEAQEGEIRTILEGAGVKFKSLTSQDDSLYEDEPTVYFDVEMPDGKPATFSIRPSQLTPENIIKKVGQNKKALEALQARQQEQQPRIAEEDASWDEAAERVEQQVSSISPEEKAELDLEMARYFKTPEGNLFVAIKRLGKIAPFKDGILTEELSDIPRELRSNASSVTLDQMASELSAYGWQFEDGEALRAAIIQQRDNPLPTFNIRELKSILAQAKKNRVAGEKLVKKIDELLRRPVPPSKIKNIVREATGQNPDKDPKVPERIALLQSLKDRVKAAKQARRATRQEIAEIQDGLVNVINQSDLDTADKGKFLNLVKNIQTYADLQRAMPEIDRRITDLEYRAERRDLIGQLRKTLARVKRSQSIAIDFVQAIEEQVAGFELKDRSPETLRRAAKALNYFQKNTTLDIPKSVMKKIDILGKEYIGDLSLDEIRDVIAKVEQLEQIGRTKLRLLKEAEQRRKDADMAAIQKDSVQISPRRYNPKRPGERQSFQQRFDNRIKTALNLVQEKNLAIAPMDVVVDILDGNKNYKGANYKIFKESADKVWSEFLQTRDRLIKPVVDLSIRLKMKQENYERIGVYAALQQDGGRDKLKNTLYPDIKEKADRAYKERSLALYEKLNKQMDDELDAIQLTEDEMQVYRAMRSAFEQLTPRIEEVMRLTYNQRFEKVQDYFSFMTDFESMSDWEIRDRFGDNRKEFGLAPRKNVQKGFTETRTLGKQKIKINAMEIFLRHVDDAAYLTEAGPTIKYLGELAATDEYGDAVGSLGQEMMRGWIDILARKGRIAGDRIPLLDAIRKNVGLATLGFKLSSALIQPTALFHGATMIGHHAFDGALKITDPKWRQFVLRNFPEIRDRVGDDPAYLDFGGKSALDKTGRAAFWALQNLDVLTASSVAAGAYIKAVQDKGGVLDLSKPDAEAITEAQRIVRRTQSSAFFKDAPAAISRGGLTGSKSVDKLLLQFQSFALNEWSLIQHDMWRAGIASGNIKQGVNIFVWLALATISEIGMRRVSKELIALLSGEDLDDWEETFTKEVVLSTVNKVPFVSQAVSSTVYGDIPVPAIGLGSRIVENIQQAAAAKKPDTRIRNIQEALILSGGYFFALPGAVQAEQILRSYNRKKRESNKYFY